MGKTPEIYLQAITDACIKIAVSEIFVLKRSPINL